jgi:hypothetical protein
MQWRTQHQQQSASQSRTRCCHSPSKGSRRRAGRGTSSIAQQFQSTSSAEFQFSSHRRPAPARAAHTASSPSFSSTLSYSQGTATTTSDAEAEAGSEAEAVAAYSGPKAVVGGLAYDDSELPVLHSRLRKCSSTGDLEDHSHCVHIFNTTAGLGGAGGGGGGGFFSTVAGESGANFGVHCCSSSSSSCCSSSDSSYDSSSDEEGDREMHSHRRHGGELVSSQWNIGTKEFVGNSSGGVGSAGGGAGGRNAAVVPICNQQESDETVCSVEQKAAEEDSFGQFDICSSSYGGSRSNSAGAIGALLLLSGDGQSSAASGATTPSGATSHSHSHSNGSISAMRSRTATDEDALPCCQKPAASLHAGVGGVGQIGQHPPVLALVVPQVVGDDVGAGKTSSSVGGDTKGKDKGKGKAAKSRKAARKRADTDSGGRRSVGLDDRDDGDASRVAGDAAGGTTSAPAAAASGANAGGTASTKQRSGCAPLDQHNKVFLEDTHHPLAGDLTYTAIRHSCDRGLSPRWAAAQKYHSTVSVSAAASNFAAKAAALPAVASMPLF